MIVTQAEAALLSSLSRPAVAHLRLKPHVPLDIHPILLRRPVMVPHQTRGGVLRHHGGMAFRACDNAVLLRMDEMPGENVGPGGRGCVYCSIDLLGCRLIGS
jgi:hypothetical protein